MSRTREKVKGFFGVKSSSSSSALALAPTAASVGSSVPTAMLPTGANPVSSTISVSQNPTLATQSNPNIDKAQTWWREHRQGLMGTLESALTIAEKALVVVPPAQAAVGAAGAALKALRLMDDNKNAIEEIVDSVEEIVQDLVGFTSPVAAAHPTSISPDAAVRIDRFNERLSKIKTAATGHSSTVRNFFQRLLDAERISEELDDAWTDISPAYDELIVATEANVVTAHAGIVDVHVGRITQEEKSLLDRLHPVKSAFHDALEAAPACLKGTRTQILSEISVWMADPSAKLVYWLTGFAGTGKTTIAQSVAYMAEERGCLAATFFFSRTTAERRRAAAVIPTLVYQLAHRHEIFRDCICRAVSSDRDISERLVVTQAKTLFADALQSSSQPLPLPLVIVLDALDECDKENGREGGDLIPVLLHSLDKLPFSVKIFITSRPEPSIKDMFGRADIHESTVGRALHRDIEQSIVREDIGRYFRHELDKLAQYRSIPLPFPSDADFQELVDRAGNLFIYAQTIVRYASSEVEDPVDRLAHVLHADADGASEQFADLDALYTQILACALDGVGRNASAQGQLRDVLASLVLIQESLPVTALSVLAGIEERQCKRVLRFLSSILLYEHVSHEPVRFIHPSFPSFLISGSRCSDTRYFVNSTEYHSVLALRCLHIMTADLRRGICDIRDPSLSNADVPDLCQQLDRNTSVQLRYACKYWCVHVQSAGCVHPDLFTALDAFCTKHLLHWLELLSWMNEVPVALRDLPLLLRYLESFDDMRQGRIHALLTEVARLLLLYRRPIIDSALHVYHSALATAPSCLLLEETTGTTNQRPAHWPPVHRKDSTAPSPRGTSYTSELSRRRMVSPHDAENGVHAHEGRKKGGGANLTTASISQPAKPRQRDEWGEGTGCMRCPEPESSGHEGIFCVACVDFLKQHEPGLWLEDNLMILMPILLRRSGSGSITDPDPTYAMVQLVQIAQQSQPALGSVAQCLSVIVANKDARADLVSRTGTDAKWLVPLLQRWVSTCTLLMPAPSQFIRKVTALLVKLSIRSGVLPQELFIKGVSIGDERDPWTSGGFADVFRGVYNHQLVAVKRLRVLNEDKATVNPIICKEALLWRQLNHPHILPFLGVDAETFASRNALCLVSPWMERGTLKQYIMSASYESSVDRDRLLHEIAQGIGYLHDENMVHGDINWVNIFVDDRLSAKIADFGLAVISEATGGGAATTQTGLKGTVAWMSPERINGASRLAPSIDVYAFGILWLTMWTRTRPFQKLSEIATLMRVTQGDRPQRPVPEDCRGETLPEDVWTFITKCWAQDPLARPRMDEVVEGFQKLDSFQTRMVQ